MRQPKSFFRVLTESGPLVALAVAIAILVGIAGPASAQFFNFGGGWSRPAPRNNGGGWFGGDFFAPFQQQAPKRVMQDILQGAAARQARSRTSCRSATCWCSATAWPTGSPTAWKLAYTERPDMGVIRKNRATSGLIKYQPKGEPSDWTAAAKQILADEKPDAIVVMLGINDRVAMRDTAPEKSDKPADKKTDKKDVKKPADAKPGRSPTRRRSPMRQRPRRRPTTSRPTMPTKPTMPTRRRSSRRKRPRAPAAASTNSATSAGSSSTAKKIEELIAVLKSKGVPVLWVGLPAVRGPKGISDMLFLDALYRDGAGKAGITYVDVWDGFVDEAGRFLQRGPDFEGQLRQLRSNDGVYFTTPGARKLAHYVDREIARLMAGRSGPIALPSEPATPDINAVPGQPAPRPMAGPIVPLVAASINNDQLLGGPGSRPAAVDGLAARTLVKGEALAPPAGRADDFAWPRREVGREQARGDSPVASVAPDGSVVPPGQKPQLQQRPPLQPGQPGFGQPTLATPGNPGNCSRKSRRSGRRNRQRPSVISSAVALATPRPHRARSRRPAPRRVRPPTNGAPRPPAAVGRSAAVPPANPTR